MEASARQLPHQHVSVRVPWHDTGWEGTVCRDPAANASCLRLRNIHRLRNDEAEAAVAGRSWDELAEAQLPACVGERASFMAPFELTITRTHPYVGTSDAHSHIAPTPLRLPAYSAGCVPFRWMLLDTAGELADALELPLQTDLEERARALMNFDSSWLQEAENQRLLLDTFWSAIKPDRSLCFFYVKEAPFVDDPRRILVGAARVANLGSIVEYDYRSEGELRSVIWERAVQHTLRPTFEDGFLLPYHQAIASASEAGFDPSEVLAFAPDDHWLAFSYGSEHVNQDAAIASLLACEKALRRASDLLPGPWDQCLRWIDQRLSEVWRLRGPRPGLGPALSAFGIEKGNLVAYEVASRVGENEDPWPAVAALMADPTSGGEAGRSIGPVVAKKWTSLPDERRALLELLSRFDLTVEQANRLYQKTERENARIRITDAELLDNPYLLYESDRLCLDSIGVTTIDRGVFPDRVVREKHPIPDRSRVDEALDARRVRSLLVDVLESAAEAPGDSLSAQDAIIQAIRELPVQPPCPVDEDLFAVVSDTLGGAADNVVMSDGRPAYQLRRLGECRDQIRREVEKRRTGKRHVVDADWNRVLVDLLGPVPAGDQAEQLAREEKAAALAELVAARVSVLIGPAGTGKTTLLSALCAIPEVRDGGVLLLAPTGKARVQLEQRIGKATDGASTIAQFLMAIDRYEPETGRYHRSDHDPYPHRPKTVIIDESSMLTEEQLSALLDGLRGFDRLILVGDPRQLPPIGVGRPFVDIVAQFERHASLSGFPRVGANFCELSVRRRQAGSERADLLLAEWFSGQQPGPGADEIWQRLIESSDSHTLSFKSWRTVDELRERIVETLVEELELDGPTDTSGFEASYGGQEFQGWIYFHPQRANRAGAAAEVEGWQILSPLRGQGMGSTDLNRFIQHHFRNAARQRSRERYRRTPLPFGTEEIIYGDKVINTVNRRRFRVYPKDDAQQYVANGEIGVAVGQFKGKGSGFKGLPWKLEVEFSSQRGFKYDYGRREFGEEGNAPLELAYAITVHKAQGSEFGRTILVIPNPCRLLSRELVYTALTRQRDRIVVLYQGELSDLKGYSEASESETARRLTNLFADPTPVPVKDVFLEERLIHRTARGELVRSKSEVIIANLLFSKELDYQYEQPLVGRDGVTRYPDFTVEDTASGLTVYWEHLGMLDLPEYRERWERKRDWYRRQGILPREDGGGTSGTLVVTRDDDRHGIDAQQIEQIASECFGP